MSDSDDNPDGDEPEGSAKNRMKLEKFSGDTTDKKSQPY
jgi:hypothetical protein